jgi:hypothetical protein
VKPRSFPEANLTLTPAPGNEADVDPIQVHRDLANGCIISYWQMSAEELEEANRNGGRVWVRVYATPTSPPIAVQVASPFEVPSS